jgi:hypothetical protein
MKTFFVGLFVLLLAVKSQAGVTLENFKLRGDLRGGQAVFTLTGTVKVENGTGDSLDLIDGAVALTSFDVLAKCHLRASQNQVMAVFERRGTYPIRVQFRAAVSQANDWNGVDFRVATSALQPIVLEGLAAETQFLFDGAARPERRGEEFVSDLPAGGGVKFSWKEARPETEGKLFFAAEMLSQISVGPGLMREVGLLNFKVMQGELSRVMMRLRGAGEITRVQGDSVLGWSVEAVTNSADRRLVIELNQAQRDQFAVQVQAQTALGAFPQTAEALRLTPENATRFAGFARVVNEGAVRLDVTRTSGVSQISPDQFPESDATRAAFRSEGKQRFAYRFAGEGFELRIAAEQIFPEVGVSELLAYRGGESETSIDADLELDVREAPLRELLLDVPRGYGVAQLDAAGLSDYFLADNAQNGRADLRLVYGQPISGRQLVRLRLERNEAFGETNWTLPRIDVVKAKSVRGYVGVAADAGLRLTALRTEALTEIATAFYPGKLEDIQAAYRLNDPLWQATLRVERLPQTVQADVLHLFSIGEGIAYGSSIINYVISGAPMSVFKVELPGENDNVEFTGQDIRNWQKTEGGYVVQLHTPVSGAYTLLATYERPFRAEGQTLAFTGARALDAQAEQGYTLVTSAYQFKVKSANISDGLLPLEPGEVPPEYRLFFDAPVLAAYRYASRPFHLELTLDPLVQGDSLDQIVDRAALETHVSKEGQVVTDVRYFVKNRGKPNFRLTLPQGTRLWSASVNNTEAVPVTDGPASLIPLPQSADPDAVLELDLKLAAQSKDATPVEIAAPIADAPVMLAEWKLFPDTGRRLVFRNGSVRPVNTAPDLSGFAQLARLFRGEKSPATPTDIRLLAPVQQAGSALTVTVSNVADTTSWWSIAGDGWPALAAVALWSFGWGAERKWLKSASWIGGWTLLAWAALRCPGGAPAFVAIVTAFVVLHAAAPCWRLWRRLAHKRALAPAAAVWVGALLCLTCRGEMSPPLPESVSQTIRVEDNYALGTVKIRWQAARGQSLPLLAAPAVLTQIQFPPRAFKLVEGTDHTEELDALENGTFDIELQYQMRVTNDKTADGFAVPAPHGLINQINLTLVNLDVDVISAQAVSIQSDHAGSNTVAALVLPPAQAWIGWQARARDVKREKPVFYAEVSQLFIPSPGVIEGAQFVSVRPAQGELGELVLDVPAGATITDVIDPAGGPLVSLWRFDPDTRKLRVTLNPAQSRTFALLIRSQFSAGPLPLEQTVGMLAVDKAAGQVGVAGIATSAEVQLDEVKAEAFSPINLEDFPADAMTAMQSQMPGLTLRRAYRYSETAAKIDLIASAVQPDVRVETDDTVSLGEDRTVLAENCAVDITRAGVFDLSFLLPEGFEVESISGAALSQWTQGKSAAGAVITLHLSEKTQGQQQFALSLAGPGVKTARAWRMPQILIREAAKQRGTLLIVPEEGMRLQVGAHEGYSQEDPQNSGIRQKGVLAFRVLQAPSNLTIDIEQVDPWIQVTSLQHAAISEAQEKVTANLLYQIENTGLKAFHVLVPANAGSVRFLGDQVADFLAGPDAVTNGLREWEVKLSRRVIGSYLLQVTYQTIMPAEATETTLQSVEAADANLQRGFVTIQSDPRLQISAPQVPEALQPAEWQSIPRLLQKDLQDAAASLTYRLVEPGFRLSLRLERHAAAKLLPARINRITFESVVADDGVMLTKAGLEIMPGDERLLSLTLPPGGRFWFAFVNDNGVWPWRDGEKILVPLERPSRAGAPLKVEIFYGCRAGTAARRALDLDFAAPKFDLPLENITWRVSLSDKWHVNHWTGSLQLEQEELGAQTTALDPQSYLQTESSLQQARTHEAEDFLALGNSCLEKGDPRQARRAFAAAFSLSTADAAFNEDARVQLHNVKLQQALIGLDARQSAFAGDTGPLGAKLRELRNRKDLNYTQQDARDIIDNNTADENAALLRLAEKLVQQQDAAVTAPAAIRASIPEEGRVLTFKRAVAVEPWADLGIKVEASLAPEFPMGTRCLILAGTFGVFALVARARRA